jgi:septal ring factor EnvC (AmiA/AmiB activator)
MNIKGRNMQNDQPKRAETKKMFDLLSRVLLRMLPILPGPEIYDLLKDLSKSRTSLDQKISRAQASLTETSELIGELEAGLKDRVTTLNRLKEEYERYSNLAKVEEDKANAIVQQIDLAIGRTKGKERIIALALNLAVGVMVFILGVFLGPWLTKWLGIGS